MEIEVTIDKKTGDISFEAQGYAGHQCVTDIQELMDLIGGSTVEEHGKDEYVQELRRQKAGT